MGSSWGAREAGEAMHNSGGWMGTLSFLLFSGSPEECLTRLEPFRALHQPLSLLHGYNSLLVQNHDSLTFAYVRMTVAASNVSQLH